MSRDYPIEALLRPAVELKSAAACGLGAFTSFCAPEYLWMTPDVASVSCAMATYLSLRYFKEGLAVKRYQKQLLILPRYELDYEDLLVSDYGLFMGMGFEWKARHAQRYRDTTQKRFEHYLEPGFFYKAAREFEVKYEKNFLFSPLTKILRSTPDKDQSSHSPWNLWCKVNPVAPLPPFGGKTAIHGVGVDEEVIVTLPQNVRTGHTLVNGTTRTGKSVLARLLIGGDIRRAAKVKYTKWPLSKKNKLKATPVKGHKPNVVICIDPKGDSDLFRGMFLDAKLAGRENEFYFFHLGFPELSCTYNMVENFQDITEIAGRSTSQLSDAGNSASFKSFAWRYVNIVASARHRMSYKPSIGDITRDVLDIESLVQEFAIRMIPINQAAEKDGLTEDDVRDLLEKGTKLSDVKDHPAVKRGGRNPETVVACSLLQEQFPADALVKTLCHAALQEKANYEKLTASLVAFLEKLNSESVAQLLSPINGDKPRLSWPEVIARGGVVYIGLDAMSNRTIATAVGNALFDDLCSYLGELYKHGAGHGLHESNFEIPEIYLYADEFNELIGEEFIPLVNKGGGAGIRITALTQTYQDIEAKIGSSAKADQILGNFNTQIFLRVRNTETAQLLTGQLPDALLDDVLHLSSATERGFLAPGQKFGSSNEDRISAKEAPLVHPSTVLNLPQGHAFMVSEGGKLTKFRIPMVKEPEGMKVPRRVADICASMRKKYYTSTDWWMEAA